MDMKDDCIFCKLANGVFPTNTIYEDDYFRVILDASPSGKGHALILPKEHFDNLFELNEEYANKLMPVAKKVSTAMKDLLKCDGLNILQNNGEVAGQTVFLKNSAKPFCPCCIIVCIAYKNVSFLHLSDSCF